jgi:hypothetical protein
MEGVCEAAKTKRLFFGAFLFLTSVFIDVFAICFAALAHGLDGGMDT